MLRFAAGVTLRVPWQAVPARGYFGIAYGSKSLTACPASSPIRQQLRGSRESLQRGVSLDLRHQSDVGCQTQQSAPGQDKGMVQACLGPRPLAQHTLVCQRHTRHAAGVADCAQRMRRESGNANLRESAESAAENILFQVTLTVCLLGGGHRPRCRRVGGPWSDCAVEGHRLYTISLSVSTIIDPSFTSLSPNPW
jgi:hypothetical protein